METQEYLQDRPLFGELENYVYDNWIDRLLKDFKPDNNTFRLLKRFIDEIGSYESMSKITSSIKKKIESALDSKTLHAKYRFPIKDKLDSPHYNNCMFISGYLGSGKTRLAIEVAQYMLQLRLEAFTPVFLIVRPSVPDNLNMSLDDAFSELLGSKNTLSEYLDAFANCTLVIVLDDVHEYFQSGIVMKDLRDLITTHSRPYVSFNRIVDKPFADQESISVDPSHNSIETEILFPGSDTLHSQVAVRPEKVNVGWTFVERCSAAYAIGQQASKKQRVNRIARFHIIITPFLMLHKS